MKIGITRWRSEFLAAACCLVTASCQTAALPVPPSALPGAVYSGYFVWDSERILGDYALQCMRLVFDREEPLSDGWMRLSGITRYVTGPDNQVNFVEAEMIYDPLARTFEMWERNATSDAFVEEGKFAGRFRAGMLFLNGRREGGNAGGSGHLTLRRGSDAPCLIADDT